MEKLAKLPAMKITRHFLIRCKERLGADFDALALGGEIRTAIAEGREDYVRYICRTDKGRRVYRCFVQGKGDAYVLVEGDHSALLTLLPPGYGVRRSGKGKRKLLRGALQ